MFLANLRPAARAALALALAIAAAGAPHGAEVQGLYTAAIPVSAKDQAARDAALSRALLAVLVKVSGERSPTAHPLIAKALRRPARYMQQFRYETVPVEEERASSPAAQQLVLSVRFDQSAVNQLLRDAGRPVWGRVRPALLAWLAVESERGRDLIGASDASGISAALAGSAAQRGLPVVLPLLDLEDRAAVGIADVWGGFSERVLEASRRYRSEAVLAGRVYRILPSLWEGRWSLMTGTTTDRWSVQADVAGAVVEEGLHAAADRLAARYARLGEASATHSVAFAVTGVQTLEGYARTLAYLDSLDLITRIQVTRVQPDQVRFRVDARGGFPALEQVVALGRTLLREDAAGGHQFRLLP